MNSSKGWETGCLLGGVLIWGCGGGGLFGFVYGQDVCELVVGYLICKGVKG
jgi:hypothetical protein